jgi:predicted Holliday junction resolvase-like endonuclease
MEINLLLVVVCLVFLLIGYIIGVKLGYLKSERKWSSEVPKLREAAVKKSREVLGGNFSEQLAPYFPDFPYSPTEARFIGKPIDLIIFKGLDNKEPEEVIFLEVKSGESRLSQVEKRLKAVIEEKKVSWVEYRVDLERKLNVEDTAPKI